MPHVDSANGKARGWIDPLPGNGDVAVFHGAYVLYGEKGKGFGTQAHAERLERAKEWGHEYAVCTVVEHNKAQLRIMEKFGWTKLSEFFSEKEGHKVFIFGKVL